MIARRHGPLTHPSQPSPLLNVLQHASPLSLLQSPTIPFPLYIFLQRLSDRSSWLFVAHQNTTRDRGRRDVMCEQEGVWSYLPLFLQMLRDGSARSGAEVGDRFDKLLRVSESSQVGSFVIHWLLYPTAAVAVCCLFVVHVCPCLRENSSPLSRVNLKS